MSNPKTEGRTLEEGKDGRVWLALNPRQVEKINGLVKSGLWGNTASQCLLRLIDEKLRQL